MKNKEVLNFKRIIYRFRIYFYVQVRIAAQLLTLDCRKIKLIIFLKTEKNELNAMFSFNNENFLVKQMYMKILVEAKLDLNLLRQDNYFSSFYNLVSY